MKQPQLSVDLAPHEQQLGKYRLVAKLGQGGMGTVYLALASGLGSFRKLLVVKELRHDLPWRESSLSMFMDEAQLAARLDHPNVLQTFEAGEAGGRYFLAMEYLDGQPLSTVIDHGIPLELHIYILCEVLQGLQYAHDLTDYDGTRLHVVHRDVSPQNVFVTHHGQVKVVDFGVAKANNGSNITSPGVFKGKFAYAAPEQLFGRPVDGRCDVFAVGVMLWEAIAGRRFGVPKPTVDAFRVRTQGLEPRIAQVTPDVDPLLAEICDHALAVDPLERVESADALRARLQEWLDLQGEHIQGKQIAELMRERFSEERVARQRIIERAMVDAGASQSTIAALPRELFERESGMSPRVEPSSASGISPAHVLPQPAAARQDSVHTQRGVPKLTHVDESVQAASLRRAAAEMKQPSRLSSAAVLVIVAGSVFGLTYQLSRRATEPPAAPQLRSGAAPEVGPRSTETSASPATTSTTSSASPTVTSDAPAQHPKPAARDAVAPSSTETRDLALEPTSRDSARDAAHGGVREPRQSFTREHNPRNTRERSERALGQPVSAQTAAGRDERGTSQAIPAQTAAGRDLNEARERGTSQAIPAQTAAGRDLNEARERGTGQAVSAQTAAGRALNEARERSTGQASSAQTAAGRDLNEARERGTGQAVSAQTAAGRDLSETRSSAAVSGTPELPAQTRATAKSVPTNAVRPSSNVAEPAAPTRTPAERMPAAKARPTGRDANMGSDMRQLRSGGAMRIDTEDPYK